MLTENVVLAKLSQDVVSSNGIGQPPEKISEQFLWISNEGLLRDEGVLYGIAGADKENKIEAIRQYFNIRKAEASYLADTIGAEIQQLKKLCESIGGELDSLDKQGDILVKNQNKETNLAPLMLQFVLYSSICSLCYFLFEYWLTPAIDSTVISVGLYCFGLFSLYIGRSIMYNARNSLVGAEEEKREKWKIYLEEFGISAVTAFFICVITFSFYPIEYSFAAFAIFFLLFLFGGKGFVNLAYRLQKDSRIYFLQLSERRKYRKKRKELRLHQESANVKIARLVEELRKPNAALRELEAEQAYKIHIFISEYNLAAGSRNSLNTTRIKKLI